MEWIKNFFRILWRLWFYVFFGASVLLMIPFLLILTSREAYYPFLYKIIRLFSKSLIFFMGFKLSIEVEEALDRDKSYMFCPNHTSMLDPFILISMVPNPIVFVGKAELSKIPIFGFFYKKVCILVDRGSPQSRREVYMKAKKRLQGGTSVAIFPEGLVPTEDIVLSPFKNGAFSLAIEHQIPIVPALYFDCKRLFSWTIFKGAPGVLRVKQYASIPTKGLEKRQTAGLKTRLYESLYSELEKDQAYMKDTQRMKTNE